MSESQSEGNYEYEHGIVRSGPEAVWVPKGADGSDVVVGEDGTRTSSSLTVQLTQFRGNPLYLAEDRPCYLHEYHSPVCMSTESHHIFPQFLQKRVWGEVRDQDMVELCGTGHNNVHMAIDIVLAGQDWPEWCQSTTTRDLAQAGLTRYAQAQLDTR